MPKKIVIATDGSTHADRAVDIGSDLAAKYGAEVVLVHVLLRDALSEGLRHMAEVEHLRAEGGQPLRDAIGRIPQGRFPIVDLIPQSAQTEDQMLFAVADRILSDAEARARRHGVTQVEREIEDGDPARRIIEVAENAGADMIVTGARGLSDWKALMLGSVSHKLAQHAPVTCLTVR